MWVAVVGIPLIAVVRAEQSASCDRLSDSICGLYADTDPQHHLTQSKGGLAVSPSAYCAQIIHLSFTLKHLWSVCPANRPSMSRAGLFFSREPINTNKLERMGFVLPWPTHDRYFEYGSGTHSACECLGTPVRKHVSEILQKHCHRRCTESCRLWVVSIYRLQRLHC